MQFLTRLTLLSVLLAAPALLRAECMGQNLIAALPAGSRAALVAAADAVPFARGNLWRATKDGRIITVIGTYHLDDSRHDTTMAAVAGDLTRATTLLVEAGPDEEVAIRADIAAHPERLVNQNGPTLPEALSVADWQRLSVTLRDRGIPPVFAAKLHPWYVTTLLAVPACQMNAATAQNGLDHRLIAAATARALPIRGLEPYDTLFTLFDSIPAPDQLALLVQTLDAAGSEDDMAVTLADTYFAGQNRLFWEFSKQQTRDLSGLSAAEADRSFALLEEAMITRRNRAWIPVITDAATAGPVVAAFGALHLPGQDGVLNLLVQQGWAVASLVP